MFILLSDLDDTLKVSHSANQLRTVFRGLFSHQAYAGMSELYQELLGHEGSSLVVLSSSPRWIRKRIEDFLRINRFPKAQILLRDWVKQPDVRRYKTQSLKTIIQEHQKPLILIGDDTEYDPEVFESIARDFPDLVLKIYIRRMRGRTLPASAEGFHTAYEIALSELVAGRLSPNQVFKVGKAIAEAKDNNDVIPYFAVCPDDITPVPDSDPSYFELKSIHEKIVQKILAISKKRKLA